MKIYLAVTIDVEPDCTPSWKYSDPLTFKGVSIGIKDILHPLFLKYQVSPTYLINNVVLEDPESVEVFKQLEGNFELGTHLHPEFIEPEKKFKDYAGRKGEANLCFYKPEIQLAKIQTITELFRKKFGYSPLSFRAGRFSANIDTINALKKCGYHIDTSVTPNINWVDKSREKPVDFRNFPEQPYYVGEVFDLPGEYGVFEVPVTILNKISLKPCSFLKTRQLWLRPYFSDYRDFLNLLDILKKKYREKDFLILNMMFHNVEVLVGSNPYIKNLNQFNDYIKILRKFFDYCKLHLITGKTLKEIFEIWKEQKTLIKH